MRLRPRVTAESAIYDYQPADNGAGPLWCFGSTVIVRQGQQVFVTGLETLPDHPPLNNCRWLLFGHEPQGWYLQHRDLTGRTREPSPLALLPPGELLVTANPTLALPGAYAGPAQPTVFRWALAALAAPPQREVPVWRDRPAFTEHSYRSVAADGPAGEVLYLQNTGYDVAHLSFRHRHGSWSGQGTLAWPRQEAGDGEPLRLCYPNVVLQNRAAHFLGVSDIVEPVTAWREAKRALTGREWDYVFRRLFYAWSPDITRCPFGPWCEIANLDATAGHLRNGDLWVDAAGTAHLVWIASQVDARLRPHFFPAVTPMHTLEYAQVQAGVVVGRQTLARQVDGENGWRPEMARFHLPGDGRLLLVASFAPAGLGAAVPVAYRMAQIDAGAAPQWADLALSRPLTGLFVTNTVRAGSPPGPVLDLVAASADRPGQLRWACVRLDG